MNVMYFNLKQGEEAAPLRNMALENFPDVNLNNTMINADTHGEKDVLYHIISQIKSGKYDKLYIKDISVFGGDYNKTSELINDIAHSRPGFQLELKGGFTFSLNKSETFLSEIISKCTEEFKKAEEIIVSEVREEYDNEEDMYGMNIVQS